MIGKDNPLSQIVVGLLRSLLACCPGSNSNGVDVKQEWQSPTLLYSQNLELYEGSSTNNSPDEARHRFIAGLYISKVLKILLKKFRLNHFFQFEYFSQLINDANGILVLLKFLNLECVDLSKSPVFPGMGELARDSLIEKCLKTMLVICYKINKGYPDRIQANLIQFKSSLIFKKLLTKFPHSIVELPCLKILRIQIKYLTKK